MINVNEEHRQIARSIAQKRDPGGNGNTPEYFLPFTAQCFIRRFPKTEESAQRYSVLHMEDGDYASHDSAGTDCSFSTLAEAIAWAEEWGWENDNYRKYGITIYIDDESGESWGDLTLSKIDKHISLIFREIERLWPGVNIEITPPNPRLFSVTPEDEDNYSEAREIAESIIEHINSLYV